MLGERGGRTARTATASKGTRGCGVNWDGMDKSRVSGGGEARSGEEEPGGVRRSGGAHGGIWRRDWE
eukprot:9234147-Pyramimonas_sp.AAC.2